MPPTKQKMNDTKPLVEESVNKDAIKAKLYNKKVRACEWDGNKLVTVILADGTRLEAAEITVK